MPVWHEKTKPWVEAGKLAVVGIVQEQHPQRTKLFMQWKRMDWPVMVDALNLLDVSVVPIAVFIDEHGIVRNVSPRPDDLDAFVAERFDAKDVTGGTYAKFDSSNLALLPFQKIEALDKAIDLLQRSESNDGPNDFRRGVALRMRFESDGRRPGDFAAAVAAWHHALDQNPNQYIWRRRIQQYGPRLDKPYPFYDWVAEAKEEISQRGEIPIELNVPLCGAEIARPADESTVGSQTRHPDPAGKVERDDRHVRVESIAVRSTDPHTEAARVHLELTIHPENMAKWNDEGGPVVFAADAGQPLNVSPFSINSPTDSNIRKVELEVSSKHGTRLPKVLKGAVFYHVCHGQEQQCVYMRQDLTIPLEGPDR